MSGVEPSLCWINREGDRGFPGSVLVGSPLCPCPFVRGGAFFQVRWSANCAVVDPGGWVFL
ncbi:hypothetical protein A2U01_0075199, partial [Trifolium medium]|nr:hypothetical protein [Trifolium medium]